MKKLPILGPVEACKSVLYTNYFNFKGRARRSEFFWFIFINSIIIISMFSMFIFPLVDFSNLKNSEYKLPEIKIRNNNDIIFIIIFSFYILYSLIPTLSVQNRRLHDTGRSGWWSLLNLIATINIIIIIMCLFDSEKKENEYGPSPKYQEKLNDEKEMKDI